MRGEKIYKFFSKSGPKPTKISNQGVRREKINFFFKSGPNGILFSNWGVREKVFEVFSENSPPICHSNLRITKPENFSENGSPKAPSILRIAKDEKFLYVLSPIFVIWSFISPTGGVKKNIFSFFRHLRSEFSNWGVREEKIINFHDLVEKQHSIFQLGSEDTQQPRKEVHR